MYAKVVLLRLDGLLFPNVTVDQTVFHSIRDIAYGEQIIWVTVL